jgi:hypothetical protein
MNEVETAFLSEVKNPTQLVERMKSLNKVFLGLVSAFPKR